MMFFGMRGCWGWRCGDCFWGFYELEVVRRFWWVCEVLWGYLFGGICIMCWVGVGGGGGYKMCIDGESGGVEECGVWLWYGIVFWRMFNKGKSR